MELLKKTVVPYSKVDIGGESVPALKHFFKCNETTGTTLTDSKGGVVCDVSNDLGVSTSYYLGFNQNSSDHTVAILGMASNSAPIRLSKGAWHTFTSTKGLLALCVSRVIDDPVNTSSHARFSIGDVNNLRGEYTTPTGLGFSSGPFHVAIGASTSISDPFGYWRVDASGTPPGVAITLASTEAPGTNHKVLPDVGTPVITSIDNHFLYKDLNITAGVLEPHDIMELAVHMPSGTKSLTAYDVTTRAFFTYGWTTASDTLTTMPTWQPNPCMRSNNMALYGYALFEFTNGIPSDYILACTWMAQEWKRGNKVIWPAWIGLT